MPTISELHAVIRPEISGQRTWNYMDAITRWHRIQFSQGFASAASYCRDKLNDLGVNADILPFTADGNQSYYACTPPECWRPTSATLDIVHQQREPERIADFSTLAPSLISRSAATGPDGIVCDLVVVDEGDTADQYAGIDVQGKIVLARGPVNLVYEHAVQRGGAAGIICEGLPDIPPVRKRPDLPDAVNYWLIPFSIARPTAFGFSVSARTGMHLRSLAEDGPVQLKAVVNAEFTPGQFEVVSGFIPGTSSDEILLVAHLCHPRPSANDNASGSAAVLEVAGTINRMINNGTLSRPRRGIRFLLVPEMTGTFAFLATHNGYKQCAAALNLDMVGADQNLCGSSLLVEHPPRSIPSYTGQLLSLIMDQVINYATTPTGGSKYPSCRHDTVAFSGGSDHYVLSDPRINIPCPMIIQWPDKFYHTSFDTVDKVDPVSLELAAAASAVYCCYLADADLPEAAGLAHELSSWLSTHLQTRTKEITFRIRDMLSGEVDAVELTQLQQQAHTIIYFEAERTIQDLAALHRLTDRTDALSTVIASVTTDITDQASLQRRRIDNLIADCRSYRDVQPQTPPASDIDPEVNRVIKLTHPGPIFFIPEPEDEDQRRLAIELQVQLRKQLNLLGPIVLYWLDGTRTIAEAMDLAEAETGQRDTQSVLTFIDFLLSVGLAESVE